MWERIAARRHSAASTGAGSPAVNSSARYASGIRRESMAANSFAGSSPSCPVAVRESTTGESGGMYQTIGIVRYSGCNGNATR